MRFCVDVCLDAIMYLSFHNCLSDNLIPLSIEPTMSMRKSSSFNGQRYLFNLIASRRRKYALGDLGSGGLSAFIFLLLCGRLCPRFSADEPRFLAVQISRFSCPPPGIPDLFCRVSSAKNRYYNRLSDGQSKSLPVPKVPKNSSATEYCSRRSSGSCP